VPVFDRLHSSLRTFPTLVVLVLVLALAVPAAAGRLDEIRARGALRAGVLADVPPFGFTGPDGTPAGFEIDLVRALSERIGVRLELVAVTSATRIQMLTAGAVDLVAAMLARRGSREEVLDFSRPYFVNGLKLLVPAKSRIQDAADLKAAKVAVAAGSGDAGRLATAAPQARMVEYPDYPRAFLAVKRGDVAAMAAEATVLLGLRHADKKPELWRIGGPFLATESYALGLPENESDFRDMIDHGLGEMWSDGTFRAIWERWFGPGSGHPLPLEFQIEVFPF